jgi:DNA-binding transcriptional LysR family regulator
MRPNRKTTYVEQLDSDMTARAKGRRLYDSRNFHISLRQLRMLHAVVDCNGFTGAANHLHLSQSAISYSIAKLQDQLGVALLRIEGRKAYITEDGRVLLNRSRNLIREALELEVLAEKLRDGWGTEVNLVVDRSYPNKLLMMALREFNLVSNNLRVSLKEVGPEDAETALYDQSADLAISTTVPHGFSADPLINIEYVAAAHPDHPLFQLNRPISMEDLATQVEVMIAGSDVGASSVRRRDSTDRVPPWYVSSSDRAIEALCEGFGYAWLPRHHLDRMLAKDCLRVLPIHGTGVKISKLYLVYGRPVKLNAGACRLAEMIHRISSGISGTQTPAPKWTGLPAKTEIS